MKYLNRFGTIVFISLLIFISCNENEEKKNFLSKEVQKTDQRTIKGSLAAIDSIDLAKFNIYDAYSIKMNQTHLFVKDSEDFKVVAISKDDFDSHYTIDIKEGKGPQEILHFQSFDVKDSLMVILDENYSKILTFKLPDIFIKEFTLQETTAHRIRILNSKSYILFTPIIGSKYLFNLMNINNKTLQRFENLPPQYNPMVYEGFINTQNDNIYYAGFSEPLLKKYASDGELAYSVATIDNFNTEANYLKTDGGAMMGYTPAAQFSTESFNIYQSYWIVIPYKNGDQISTNLDIYNEHNGHYLGSLEGLKPRTKDLQIDDTFIYAVSTDGEKFMLTRYKNDIQF